MSSAVRRLLGGASVVSAATVGTVAAYLATISIAGLLPRRRDGAAGADLAPVTRFVVMVPAHDEETVIGEALAAFDRLDYPADLFDVHVVADNCTDRTADLVEAGGWHAHRRDDPARPGKGPALNWLFDRVVDGTAADAVVVVDADASLDPGFLLAMDRAWRTGIRAAQGYYSVRDADHSAAASFRFAALACRHRLRPLGRVGLGGSSGLYGSGMVFEPNLLADHRWSGHLVEDAELQNELLLAGVIVDFVPDAVLFAEIPDTNDAARSQNERWERGRIELAIRFVPRLLRELPRARGRRVACVDAVLDHLTPPISVLVVAGGVGSVIGGLTAATGARSAGRIATAVHLASIGVVVAHTVAGLLSAGADRRHLRALSTAPVHIAWKARLWASMLLTRREVAWVRTRRNDETGASTP